MLAGSSLKYENQLSTAWQPPDPARRDELAHRDPRRVVAVHERLHQQHARPRAQASTIALRLGRGQRQRLLAQDVLAGPRRGDRPFGVEVVRQRDVDGVDVRVGEQRLVRPVDRGMPSRRGRLAGPARLARRDARAPRCAATAGGPGSPSPSRCSRSTGRPSGAVDRVAHGGSIPSPTLHRRPPGALGHRRRLDTDPRLAESGTRLQERITNLASRPRRRRAAQRDRSPSEPERDRPRAARARPAVPVRAGRGAPGLTRSAIRALVGELAAAGLVTEERRRPPRDAGPALPARPAEPDRRGGPRPRDPRRLDRGRDRRPRRRDPRARPASTGRAASCRSTTSVADLAALAGDLRARGDWPIVGIGVAVAGVVRRDDGLVSMAPNLGWIDVPLGARLAARARPSRCRSASPTTPTPASWASTGAGAAVGVDNVLFVSGEVGVGGGLIVDGRPADRASPGSAARSATSPVNPDGAAAAAARVGCWETEVGEGSCSRCAGSSGRRGPRRHRRGPARGRGRRPSRAIAAIDARRPLAGHRARPGSSTSSTRGS